MKSPRLSAPLASSFLQTVAVTPLDVAVVGLGYVGLVTAACLASLGHRVHALDNDDEKIERLCRGDVTIHEAGLAELVRAELAAGRLVFTSDPHEALPQAGIVFVTVGTPSREDGSSDTSAIDEVTRRLSELVRFPSLVVIKSTVPVGTAARMQAELADSCESAAAAPRVMSNPEFLREGSAVADFMRPDRLIIGDDQPAGPERVRLIAAFGPLVASGVPVLEMDTRSAELAKASSNAMLAARISFINEIAAIASATGADIERVCEGIGSDPRIGPDFMRAGLGYGGSCLGKDVAALRETARRHNLRSDMLLATERINSRQRCWAFDALRRDLGGREALRGLRVAIWGLAFKPGTDDMRDAPSLALIDRLWRAGASLTLYDPVAMKSARPHITETRRIAWASSAEGALLEADVLVLVTEWPELVQFSPARAAAASNLRAVYDGRNSLDTQAWTDAGLRVVQVGRPSESGRLRFDRRVGTPPLGHGIAPETEQHVLP